MEVKALIKQTRGVRFMGRDCAQCGKRAPVIIHVSMETAFCKICYKKHQAEEKKTLNRKKRLISKMPMVVAKPAPLVYPGQSAADSAVRCDYIFKSKLLWAVQ